MAHNEQEIRFFLIDPVLRDKGYNDHQWPQDGNARASKHVADSAGQKGNGRLGTH